MMTDWISVKDAMPKESEDVLILTIDDEEDREIFLGFFEDGEWYTQWCHGCATIDEQCTTPIEVTHWMELPPIPYRLIRFDKH